MSKINLKLDNRQCNLILQSLLSSCVSEISVEWKFDDLIEMVSLIKTLEHHIDDLELDNVSAYVFKDPKTGVEQHIFEEEWTRDLIKHFGASIKTVDINESAVNI